MKSNLICFEIETSFRQCLVVLASLALFPASGMAMQFDGLPFINRTNQTVNVLKADQQGLMKLAKRLQPGERYTPVANEQPIFETRQGPLAKIAEESFSQREQSRSIGVALVAVNTGGPLSSAVTVVNQTSNEIKLGFATDLKRPNGAHGKQYAIVAPRGTKVLPAGATLKSLGIWQDSVALTSNAAGSWVFSNAGEPAPGVPEDGGQQAGRKTLYVNHAGQTVRLGVEVQMGNGGAKVWNTIDLAPNGSHLALPGGKPVTFTLADGTKLEQRFSENPAGDTDKIVLVKFGQQIAEVAPAPELPQAAVRALDRKMLLGTWYEVGRNNTFNATITVDQNLQVKRSMSNGVVSSGSIDALQSKLTLINASGQQGVYRLVLEGGIKLAFQNAETGQPIAGIRWERGR